MGWQSILLPTFTKNEVEHRTKNSIRAVAITSSIISGSSLLSFFLLSLRL